MSAGVEPSPDEVIVVLAQVAFIALALAAIVFATRAAQGSFDKKKVEAPVRLQAVESSQQRLRTLSDRSQFHRAAAAAAGTKSTVGTDGAGAGAAGPPSIWQRGDSHNLSFARDPSPPYQNAALHPTEGAGGTVNVLTAAAAAHLHRRHVPPSSSISSDPASCTASGLSSTASTAPLSTASTGSNSSCATTSTWAWQGQALDRSCSFNGQHYQQQGGGSGALQHKCSDSLLETCRVFASVPHETITSTRQVLAAFNYDYSALHRRESSYVSGTRAWHARTGL
ncbi:hypothetical protein Vafri_7708 [Volvox africanus]|uniref:Uncharacterized protein n=1 Tax=Volvox africanus TaxID=51714 RepID=A0A8J4EX93_9CHLO|nr:hypothetical protein Vafri_7708 [Volvox africanus]